MATNRLFRWTCPRVCSLPHRDRRQRIPLRSIRNFLEAPHPLKRNARRTITPAMSLETLTADTIGKEISTKTDACHIGLIFSPGGFLVSYYLGVIHGLQELKVLLPTTPVSGTSAGALAAAFLVSDMSIDECTTVIKTIQERLLETGYGWKVIGVLKKVLEESLPVDVHERASGRVGIGVTCYAKGKGRPVGKVLTQFASRSQFIDAVAGSCYIPYYLGPRLGIEWHDGSIYSDGMPTTFFPDVSPDSELFRRHTVTISAFPRNNRRLFDDRRVDISPDLRPKSEIPSVWKIMWNGLVPLKMEEVEFYRQKGYDDTHLWANGRSVERHSLGDASL